jgi:hypothetical protein
MDFENVVTASWEIRKDLGPGREGTIVAFDVSPAVQTRIEGKTSPPLMPYRVEVSGLNMELPPGRYWVSVAPIGSGKSFLQPTWVTGINGESIKDNGPSLVFAGTSRYFQAADHSGAPGSIGYPRHFAQGVVIASTSSSK